MNLQEASKLIGRKVLWNPKSECSGAGSIGVIKGVSKKIIPWGVSESKNGEVWAHYDEIYLSVSWEKNPNHEMGSHIDSFSFDDSEEHIILKEIIPIENETD